MTVSLSTLQSMTAVLNGSGSAYTTGAWTAPGSGEPILHCIAISGATAGRPDIDTIPSGWTEVLNETWGTDTRFIVLADDGTSTGSETIGGFSANYKCVHWTRAFTSDAGAMDEVTDFVSAATPTTGSGTSATTGSVTLGNDGGLMVVWAVDVDAGTFDETPSDSFTDVDSLVQAGGPGADVSAQTAEQGGLSSGSYTSTDGWSSSGDYYATGFGYAEPGGGAQNIAMNLLDASPTLNNPAVAPGQVDVVLNLLDASPTLNNPTVIIDQFVVAQLLDASPTLFNPAVSAFTSIVMNQLDASPTLNNPAVAPGQVDIVANLVDASPTLHDPTVILVGTTQQIAMNLLSAGATIFDPTVIFDQFVVAPQIDSAPSMHTPGISTQAYVVLPLLDASAALSQPSVSPGTVVIAIPLIEDFLEVLAPVISGGAIDLTGKLTVGRYMRKVWAGGPDGYRIQLVPHNQRTRSKSWTESGWESVSSYFYYNAGEEEEVDALVAGIVDFSVAQATLSSQIDAVLAAGGVTLVP